MAAKAEAPTDVRDQADEDVADAPTFDIADSPDARLTAALAAAQAAFPPIPKSHTAEVRPRDKPAYSYSYADLADVLAAVRPVLARHGLAVVQRTARPQGGATALVTELRHIAGGILTSETEISASPGNPQQFGGSLTYLRRYELTTLLGIAAEEDRDAQDVEPDRRGQAPAPELPTYARLITRDDRDRLAAFTRATRELVTHAGGDKDTADGLIRTWARACGGGIPAAVYGVIVDSLHAALVPQPDETAKVDAERQAQAGEEPQAQPTDEPADTAAEPGADLPDAPPADPEPEAPADAPDKPAAAPEPPPPPAGYDHWPRSEEVLARLVEDRKGAGLQTSEAEAREHLRRVGCRCLDPLDDKQRDDACPFPDHGIPF